MSQAKVIKYFIKSSPVGEVNFVLEDVEKIVDKECLETDEIKQALRDHFESHHMQVKLDDGRMAMVSKIGLNNPVELENGTTSTFVYFDQKLGVKFCFDPRSMQATVLGTESDFPEQLDEQWAGYKTQVQEAVDAYVEKAYRKGTTRSSLCFNSDGHLQVDISCISLNFNSFWGGEWQSEWVIDTQEESLSGQIRINNHYFEQGNIQFSLKKSFDARKLAASDGEGICAEINKLETNYQLEIENMHENLRQGMFKKMRRFMPVTGTKFDWDKPKLMH